MLLVLATKFLLKGAIKKIIIQPALSATLSIIPHAGLVDVTLLGNSLSFTTSDLLKFGIEKLYERYGEKKLEFKIAKLQNHMYQIKPGNDLAAHFFKEYVDEEELLVDLNRVDQYLDVLHDEDMATIDENELELDDATMQILHDLDTIIEEAPNYSFISPQRELELIDEIMSKNKGLIDATITEKLLNWDDPQSAVEEILMDFPKAPYQVTTDNDAIEAILNKFKDETNPKKRGSVSG